VKVIKGGKLMISDYVFYRNFKQHHPIVERGEGIYIYDKEGKRYIDACSGALVSNIGHGVEEIVEAMYAQAKKDSFRSFVHACE